MVHDLMQAAMNYLHARGSSRDEAPHPLTGRTVVNEDATRQLHAALKLIVHQSLWVNRSLLIRVLYNLVRLYVAYRSRAKVDIFMSYPDAQMLDARVADGNKCYQDTKALQICPSAHFTGEDVTSEAGTPMIQTVDGCHIHNSAIILREFMNTSLTLSDATVASLADMMRGLVVNKSFNWHSSSPPGHRGSAVSRPGA